ncbi:MAG: glycosyltransferase [Clostridia bacterium]|nr:glycosyltransferase [Clostridia bacterium]
MKKVLFLIHDLGVGGAEKVLVNLVNHLDRSRFDVTVISLFGGGVNEQFLLPHVHYRAVWRRALPGNSKLMQLLSPAQLHRLCVRERYDVEVAYLEGPAARVISGCPDPTTRLLAWIHSEQESRKKASASFRSYQESVHCYECFHQIVFVSDPIRQIFCNTYPTITNTCVRYNTIETDRILQLKDEPVADVVFDPNEKKLVAVGKISKSKGFDRLARIVKRLRDENIPAHLYALGVGADRAEIEDYLRENNLQDYYTFLGYQTNPYAYVARCDLFVCASWAEGFSTAATEALIVGTPVCTVEVSGMKEMLGEHDEYGVVTKNDDEALYAALKSLLTDPAKLAHYRTQAALRGKTFSTENTVKAVEELLTKTEL